MMVHVFLCGDWRGPHSWKLCQANGKTFIWGHLWPSDIVDAPQTGVEEYVLEHDKNCSGLANPGCDISVHAPLSVNCTPKVDEGIHFPDGLSTDCDWCFGSGTQVHSIASVEKSKRHFTNLSLSTTGLTFEQVRFQIDTAATCNTMSASTLRSFFSDVEVNRSLPSTSLWKLQAASSDWSGGTNVRKEQQV
ncbi:unnamed protein product [Pocillopora meandrina]|uniref:Uncharacterized protein n=1 Tax=Pocillopora meandrina TaxID=46732 RepID=A0AAU9WQB6_9CNID|nr:unnamed protein product [Pocillopora meandrina]